MVLRCPGGWADDILDVPGREPMPGPSRSLTIRNLAALLSNCALHMAVASLRAILGMPGHSHTEVGRHSGAYSGPARRYSLLIRAQLVGIQTRFRE